MEALSALEEKAGQCSNARINGEGKSRLKDSSTGGRLSPENKGDERKLALAVDTKQGVLI